MSDDQKRFPSDDEKTPVDDVNTANTLGPQTHTPTITPEPAKVPVITTPSVAPSANPLRLQKDHPQEAETVIEHAGSGKIELPQDTGSGTGNQEAQTRIVSKQGDPSIFDTATVIRPADVSASEVTRYFKELKGNSNFEELKMSSTISPFPEVQSAAERRASRAERRAPGSGSRGGRRRNERRNRSSTSEADLFSGMNSFGEKLRQAPPWLMGVALLLLFIVIFAISTIQSGPVAKTELSTDQRPVNEITEDGFFAEGAATAQLKVEFLSDLHKNIETTKAHAPLY